MAEAGKYIITNGMKVQLSSRASFASRSHRVSEASKLYLASQIKLGKVGVTQEVQETQEHATFAKDLLRREALWRSRGFRRLHLLSLSLSRFLPAFWHSPSSANQDSFFLSV